MSSSIIFLNPVAYVQMCTDVYVLSSHRVSERGFGRKADRVPMKAAVLRRRERPVHGAGRRTAYGGHR